MSQYAYSETTCQNIPRARTRSTWRLRVGGWYYRVRRYVQWYAPKAKFAKSVTAANQIKSGFPLVAFSHESLLLRELRSVDMWLQHNKVHNLSLAIRKLNGLTLQPGETMSFWRLVGSPSHRKGYKQGMVLVNGGFKPGVGGGLCQLTNLVYWMTLHTPLQVKERYRHQYDVFPDSNRTLPFGSGATIAFNYIDLQIHNGTQVPYCLHLYLSDTHLHGEWCVNSPQNLTYEVYESNHHITQQSTGHYVRHNQIWRRSYDEDGICIQDDLMTENHALMMYSPLLSDGSSVQR